MELHRRKKMGRARVWGAGIEPYKEDGREGKQQTAREGRPVASTRPRRSAMGGMGSRERRGREKKEIQC